VAATQVAPGVWQAGTRFVNWYVVDGGSDGLTVVDAGLPRYAGRLDADLRDMGRSRADVRAVVLTHGHVDHIGFADVLAEQGAQVHLHPADQALAADPRTNRTDASVLPYLRWPATLAFAAHAAAQGALRPRRMPPSVALQDGAVAAVPGRPVVTHVPGHTDGSCLLEFREHGVAFVGDLLCTADPRTGRSVAPQLQTRGSNRDSAQAMRSLERLEGITSRLVLPGHGSPWGDGVAAAVVSAREAGCR
jgi:glyoxylase-like metal-dependent hydrolase (beta-lactamase superfamily II)